MNDIKKGGEELKMTPLEAIRKMCVDCVGSPYDVKDCGGDQCLKGQGDENAQCYFHPYRMGKGRPSVKTIRKFCLECQGESIQLVAECGTDCPLHQYRFGKNPKRAGMGKIGNLKPGVSGEILAQNRISQIG
jgi:hypothetical protein